MQQEEGMAPLRKEIELLVERFDAPAEVKASVKQNAEHLATKVMQQLGPTKAAIASVAQEFLRMGRNIAEVSSSVSELHPGLDRLKDLVVEVYPEPEGEVRVLVDGIERPYRAHSAGLYRRLRIPVFTSDAVALVELKGARLTKRGYDPRRVRPQGPTEFVIRMDERSFELFKVLEEARLAGGLAEGGGDLVGVLRKYSVSRLPVTERLLRESGLLQTVNAEYARRLAASAGNGHGRTPRKLAEETLLAACASVVPPALSTLIVRKYHLKPSAMSSLVVKSELDAWQG
jgi:hypothetical protein